MLDALLDFFIRGKNNPHFATHIFDLGLIKLDKVCDVEDTKFVSFLACFRKRPRSEGDSAKITLKKGLKASEEEMTEAELVKYTKIVQYES